jgi:uncharacterized coiled-coil DUF342 family protein
MLSQNEKNLRNKLNALTQEWTHLDWRKVRNIDYFFSDYLPMVESLIHKLERIEYYNQNGVIKPYSAPKIEMLIYDIEKKRNKAKSPLDPSKTEITDEETNSNEPFV